MRHDEILASVGCVIIFVDDCFRHVPAQLLLRVNFTRLIRNISQRRLGQSQLCSPDCGRSE